MKRAGTALLDRERKHWPRSGMFASELTDRKELIDVVMHRKQAGIISNDCSRLLTGQPSSVGTTPTKGAVLERERSSR